MIKKVLSILIVLLGLNGLLFSNDFTEEQLDRSIEEFSKKNYEIALQILEGVLEIEPENSIALMYKKTIEDVISIDKEIIAELDEVTTVESSKDSSTVNKEILPTSNDSITSIKRDDLFSLSTYIGKNENNFLVLEDRLKIVLGSPVVEVKVESTPLNYDIVKIRLSDIPLNDILNIENYSVDLGIGYRFKPFKNVAEDGGYFDIKLGATNFSRDGDCVVPYIGFDTEVFILSSLADNIISNNIWVGGGGSLYNFNGEFVNNYKIEAKAGISFSIIKLGAFYRSINMDSLEIEHKRNRVYGLMLGFTL